LTAWLNNEIEQSIACKKRGCIFEDEDEDEDEIEANSEALKQRNRKMSYAKRIPLTSLSHKGG